jgi:hypothetical protein
MNPAAVAVFFHKVCSAVLEALVSPKDTDMGVLHINLLRRRRIKQPWNARFSVYFLGLIREKLVDNPGFER